MRIFAALVLLLLVNIVSAQSGGIFGNWEEDSNGVYFEWTMNQRTDPRARWPNTESGPPLNITRTDHFQVFGNQRVNAMAVDDGYVSLLGTERGPTWFNRFSEPQLNLAGGFSYVRIFDDENNGEMFCSAFRYAPSVYLNTSLRRFGVSSFNHSIQLGPLRLTHFIYAPFGDDPLLLDTVQITNMQTNSSNVSFSHFEYWDVNRHQLMTEWVRTGTFGPPGDALRDALNGNFTQSVRFDTTNQAIVASMTALPEIAIPSRSDPSSIDWYPPDIFLASLDEGVSFEAESIFSDQLAFFGNGTPAAPQAVVQNFSGDGGNIPSRNAFGQSVLFALRNLFELSYGETVELHFAFGYVPSGVDLSTLLQKYRVASKQDADAQFLQSVSQWSASQFQLSAFPQNFSIAGNTSTEFSENFQRELLWRSAQLLQMSTYRDYFSNHLISQGAVYLYLHGAEGVPRDQSLFTLPVCYLDPSLARETLSFLIASQRFTTGELPYAYDGHGVLSSALGLHAFPDDLEAHLFFALVEYLVSTGDYTFLDAKIPYYPLSDNNNFTVMDHLRRAMAHLTANIGYGSHGLLRLGDGDWDDGVAYTDSDPMAILYTILYGESVATSGQLAFVLPQISSLIESRDADLAEQMRAMATNLSAALMNTYGGRWFGRAWLRDGANQPYLLQNDSTLNGDDVINLQSQTWPLLSGLLSDNESQQLCQYIQEMLDNNSPIGIRLVPGGEVWPAISGMAIWAYTKCDSVPAAWTALSEALYASHASAYPDSWVGLMAGPDGYSGNGTWASPVTPAEDFPVSNANSDAMFLFGAIRLFGIEPLPAMNCLLINTSRFISYDSRGFGLKLPLLELNVSLTQVSAIYHASNSGSTQICVSVSNAQEYVIGTVFLDGKAITQTSAQVAMIPLIGFDEGDRLEFTVNFSQIPPQVE